jgi:hypothetical protein
MRVIARHNSTCALCTHRAHRRQRYPRNAIATFTISPCSHPLTPPPPPPRPAPLSPPPSTQCEHTAFRYSSELAKTPRSWHELPELSQPLSSNDYSGRFTVSALDQASMWPFPCGTGSCRTFWSSSSASSIVGRWSGFACQQRCLLQRDVTIQTLKTSAAMITRSRGIRNRTQFRLRSH